MAKPLGNVSRSLPKSSISSASSSSSSSASVSSVSHPPWINPCNLPFYALPSDVITDPRDIYNKVSRRAVATKNCTERVKKCFIDFISDSDFESGVSHVRQEWLPEIRPISKETIESIEEDEAFRQTFQYLQYYAVGFEQIILDQLLHEGMMVNEFHEIEEHLGQLLCEVQLGMWYREISPDRHVGQEAMSQEYRDIGDASRRMIRDYLLLRDFIEMTDFISQVFSMLSKKHGD